MVGKKKMKFTDRNVSLKSWFHFGVFPQKYVNKWKPHFGNWIPFENVSNEHINKAIRTVESLKTVLMKNHVTIKQVEDVDWNLMKFKSPFYTKQIK